MTETASGDDDILALEAELRAAMMANDVAALERLLDDGLVFAGPDGAVATKADDLAAHRARRLRLTRLDPSDRHVLRLGDVAVVSVRMDMAGSWDGAPLDGAYRYTRVWCARPEGWRIVAGQVGAVG